MPPFAAHCLRLVGGGVFPRHGHGVGRCQDCGLKSASIEEELGPRINSPYGRTRLEAVEREKLERYQRRYEEYTRVSKALTWAAYGVVRVMMGLFVYGGEDWFPRRKPRIRDEPTR